MINRRQLLHTALASPALVAKCESVFADQAVAAPKRIAAVLTAYQKGLHADVLLGKILEGWRQDGGPGPRLELVSMYVDQFPSEGDLARPMSRKHNVPIFDTIEGALTLGKDDLPIDGVICIGEHGNYPYNEIGQHLYPRRRFFAGIADTLEKYNRVVPVFHDKHLGPQWDDAIWMYRRGQQLNIPFMAGSSLPVTYRKPDLKLNHPSPIRKAVGIGYSGLDIYGIHTLECYQCLVELRREREVGVRRIQCIEGEDVRRAIDRGRIDRACFEAALKVTPTPDDAPQPLDSKPTAFLFDYVDGFQGSVVMLGGAAAGISAAVQLEGEDQPRATLFEERTQPAHPHFAFLLKAIERMMWTGKPSYPVERTLLTGGILDRVLHSRADGFRARETPELQITYRPTQYPHAPEPELR